VTPGDIKPLLATTLVYAKALLVFDVNDGSRDHSIALKDFKRSLPHMDVHVAPVVANQVHAIGTRFNIFFNHDAHLLVLFP
jgi:hypothetical protein